MFLSSIVPEGGGAGFPALLVRSGVALIICGDGHVLVKLPEI